MTLIINTVTFMNDIVIVKFQKWIKLWRNDFIGRIETIVLLSFFKLPDCGNPPGCFPDLVNENSSIQLADSQLPYIQYDRTTIRLMTRSDKKKIKGKYIFKCWWQPAPVVSSVGTSRSILPARVTGQTWLFVFVCRVLVWVVEIILVVDEMARPGCLCFFVCCFFVCLGVDDG